MDLIICTTCRELLDESAFGRRKERKNSLRKTCRACRNKQAKERRKRNPELYRAKDREAYRRNHKRIILASRNRKRSQRKPADRAKQRVYEFKRYHSTKGRAKYILQYAISTGKIVRPQFCSDCGVACQTHAHHEDYTKPLDVIFLCVKCHQKRHRRYA